MSNTDLKCPNCGEDHKNKGSWYCSNCEEKLSKLGLPTKTDKLKELNNE